MTIHINHERYGESTFATLAEAQSAIRACGPEFATTTLRINALLCVIDERDEEIGNETVDTVRTVTVINGDDSRELEVLRSSAGTFLWDCTADPRMDSLTALQDDSDESVADAIRGNGFSLVEA